PGLDGPAMVAAAAAGELGVLLLAGVDLIRDHGPRELATQALERAFVIAIDHEVNDTTSQADVLLPGMVHAETDGTFTDWEGRVQATHRAVPVGGAAQQIWDLADQLALRLGADLNLHHPDHVTAETERFRQRPALVASTAPAAAAARTTAEAPDDGLLSLISYPLLLDAASMLARAADLNRETPGAFVELHPDDAGRLGLADGGTAEVDFGQERTARLPVRVAPTVAPGCVFVPANQPDLALRALIGQAPALRVKVTAVEEAAA
ncbi:MAG TPA: molybdopterin-dependent oxidoreductase, partial [Actinomycetes bacterium]|nr:molybdopterin-dependent oxidoreductase [Actinomycetes bacterium]